MESIDLKERTSNNGSESEAKRPSSPNLGFRGFFIKARRTLGNVPVIKWLINLESKVATLLSLLLKFLVFVILLGIFSLLYQEMKQKRYTIEAFQVPDSFEAGGFDGIVIANRVLDQIEDMKTKVASQKADSLNFNSETRPEMNVSVMGFGVSLQSIIYYTRQILGRENRTIGGELTELDSILQLKLRVTGMKTMRFEQTYFNQNRLSALEKLFESAASHILMQTDPYRLALYQSHQGNYSEALKTIRYLLNDARRDTEWAYLAWGNMLRSQRKYEEARDKFLRSIKVNPDFPLPYYNLGWTHRNLGQPAEAIPYFKKATELQPGRGQYWNGLAWAYLSNDEFEKAEESMLLAIETDPVDSDWLGNYVDLKMQIIAQKEQITGQPPTSQDTAQLVTAFEKSYEVSPETSQGCMSLAGYHYFLGNLPEALKMIRLAIDLDPENANALTQYRGAMFEVLKDYDEAIRANRQLLVIARRTGNRNREQSALNHLAMNKYAKTEYDSALYYVQEAIAIDTNTSYPYTTLAETYGLMGEDELFYQALQKAIEKGFNLHKLMNQEPYRRYQAQKRFQNLLLKK